MRRLVTTRKQREAVFLLFQRHYPGLFADLVYVPGVKRKFRPRAIWRLYRLYRKRFAFAGCCSDYYLFGQPYQQGEHQLWVGIETDGYCHS